MDKAAFGMLEAISPATSQLNDLLISSIVRRGLDLKSQRVAPASLDTIAVLIKQGANPLPWT